MGGAFNPPHFGHLRPAREALELLGLEKILFLPSGEHPLKESSRVAPAEHRLAMTGLAIAPEPQFELCDLDVKRSGISYSVDSLARLSDLYPDQELVFMVGGDILTELHLWKDWPGIFNYAHLAMLVRPGAAANLARTSAESSVVEFLRKRQVAIPDQLDRQKSGLFQFIQLAVEPLAISSTQIRKLVGRGLSCRSLTPAGVVDYINQNQLYVSE